MLSTKNGKWIIRLNGLRKSYGDLKAVKDHSLDIRRGEIFGFLGPNGAGKTTTISMICGLLKQDAGEISIDGFSLESDYKKCKKWMGLCPQEIVIWESLTCLEQMEFTARLYDVPRSVARNRSLELLGLFGLEEKQNKLSKTLSGGMKRRLNIALALVHDPQIVILDEPQAGLDPQSRILVREYILSLAGEKTVLLTTHDMDEANELCDRVAIINQGRLAAIDAPEQLRVATSSLHSVEVSFGSAVPLETLEKLPGSSSVKKLGDKYRLYTASPGDLVTSLVNYCCSCGLKIVSLSTLTPSLEDAFVALTDKGEQID